LQTAVPLFRYVTLHHSIIVSRRLQTIRRTQNIMNKVFSDVVSYPKWKTISDIPLRKSTNLQTSRHLRVFSFLSGSRAHCRGNCYVAAHRV